MYTITETKDKDKIKLLGMVDPFGPRFPANLIEEADELVVLGTTFKDDGEYCEFILHDKDGETIASRTIAGY